MRQSYEMTYRDQGGVMARNSALGHIPSYADLNTIEAFQFPEDYLDSNRIKISNNLKVSEIEMIFNS